jgi:hypothetical protein
MEEHEVVASEALPAVAEYIELRTRTGWGSIDAETADKTHSQFLCAVTACSSGLHGSWATEFSIFFSPI